MDPIKLKTELQDQLGRQPSISELTNASNDPILVMRILMKKTTDLETRVQTLEKINNVVK